MFKYLFALVMVLGFVSVSDAQYVQHYSYNYKSVTPYGYNYSYGFQRAVVPTVVVPAYPYAVGPYGNYGVNPLLRGNFGYQEWYGQRPFSFNYGFQYRSGFGFWR